MTESDWLAALQAATTDKNIDGMSSNEIAIIWGSSIKKTRERIAACMARGVIEFVGNSNRPAIDGTMRPVPVYRVKTLVDTGHSLV